MNQEFSFETSFGCALLTELGNGDKRFVVLIKDHFNRKIVLVSPSPFTFEDAAEIYEQVNLADFSYLSGQSKLQLREFENTQARQIVETYWYSIQPRNEQNPAFEFDRQQMTNDWPVTAFQEAISTGQVIRERDI